jgi:hypothetical protein
METYCLLLCFFQLQDGFFLEYTSLKKKSILPHCHSSGGFSTVCHILLKIQKDRKEKCLNRCDDGARSLESRVEGDTMELKIEESWFSSTLLLIQTCNFFTCLFPTQGSRTNSSSSQHSYSNSKLKASTRKSKISSILSPLTFKLWHKCVLEEEVLCNGWMDTWMCLVLLLV